MSNQEPFYAPNRKLDKPREPQPGELLFSFERFTLDRGMDHYRCELRDHGEWGWEAQFFKNGEFMLSHRWPSKQQAIAWAAVERDAIVKGWTDW